jgi:RNA polymerase sigma-70 factor (ECF subfamily)
MRSESDEHILHALGQGDENALRILVERYSSSVYRFSVRYTGDESLAEDVAQEVFLRLFLHANKYTAGRSFKTWLFTIVRNVSIDLARPYSYRKSSSSHLNCGPAQANFSPELIVDESPTQEDQLAKQEQRKKIIHALQDLPEKQRASIILKYYEHMSNREIAEILHKSVSSVEALLARAKKNLAELLKI